MVTPSQITWLLTREASVALADIRSQLGEPGYSAQKAAFKVVLAHYFSTTNCNQSAGGISSMGGTTKGGKAFKMRWAIPGRGKSGGLRLALVAYCPVKKVIIGQAFIRKDDPPDAVFQSAFTAADSVASDD
jgi:hypothetical protein